MEPRLRSLVTVLVLAFALNGCGGEADLRPEIRAHLDEYEKLIASYEPRFARVRGNLPEFAKVAASYSEQAKAWIRQWDTVAPDLTDEEGKAIRARIDRLNRRAEKMLRSG